MASRLFPYSSCYKYANRITYFSKQTLVVRPLSCNLHISWRERWKLLSTCLFLSLRWYLTLQLLSMAMGLFLLTWNQYEATLGNRVYVWDSVLSTRMVFSSTAKDRWVIFYGWRLSREDCSKWNLISDGWSEERRQWETDYILILVGDVGSRRASLRFI